MGELPNGKAETPLELQWSGLTVGSRVWTNGFLSSVYVRGALMSAISKQVYTSLSEVLINKVTKSLVWVRTPLFLLLLRFLLPIADLRILHAEPALLHAADRSGL